jgi:hypothetical protein
MTSSLNEAFLRLSKRAETNDISKLVATFVDIGPIFSLLSTVDHQILYGRRGTGKTHALIYLAEKMRGNSHISIYIDMRIIGSTGGLYSDSNTPITQRATRLLLDTFECIHNSLYEFFIDNAEEFNLSVIGPLLDKLADAITQVQVVGNVEKETSTNFDVSNDNNISASASISPTDLSFNISKQNKEASSNKVGTRLKEMGQVEQVVQFGPLGTVLKEISTYINPKRIWILLDEWSSVPFELQPYLADLIRRSIFPIPNFSVKIAAIEQRSLFRISNNNNDYIGIEIGADIAADVDLDDFMVFDNNAERSTKFFQELLFKHVKEVEWSSPKDIPSTSDELVKQGFTQRSAFEEFVRATEGIPRDAINIMSIAALKAVDDKISVVHIRSAARSWYQRDKEVAAKTNIESSNLLHWIIDNVIGSRKARAFLLKNDSIPDLIEDLFDARVIHVLKKNISASDKPGIRYDAYKLDYGCYVDLISTSRAPEGLFPEAINVLQEYDVDVPPDDYRAIRRAILDINEYYQRDLKQLPFSSL